MSAPHGTAIAERLVTAEELLDHPEWNPCELVRGEVVHMSPANAKHGQIAIRITRKLLAYVDAKDAGELFAAETGFVLERNPDTVRGPDIMFLAKKRIPRGGIRSEFLPVPPDLAVEVVSPSDPFSEVMKKAQSYTAAGVRLVWVVDPQTRQAHVFQPGKPMATLSAQDSLSGEDVLPDFSLPLAEVFR
jgi:Uma2 family endonuclease